MHGGLSHTFRCKFLYISVYYGRFSGGPFTVTVGKNCWWGFLSKSIFIPITIERISLSDVILRQAGKECVMHLAAKVSQQYRR